MSDPYDHQLPAANPSADPQASEPQQDQGRSRRHLLKAGLAAVPMVLTLRGRPAQAQTLNGSPGGGFVTGSAGSVVTGSEGSPGFLESNSSASSSTWSRSSWTSEGSTRTSAEGESN